MADKHGLLTIKWDGKGASYAMCIYDGANDAWPSVAVDPNLLWALRADMHSLLRERLRMVREAGGSVAIDTNILGGAIVYG